jgi:DNA polymerase III subunit gamma/tau
LTKKPSNIQTTGKIPDVNKISRDFRAKVQEKAETLVLDAEPTPDVKENSDFTPEQLALAWKSYTDMLRNEGKSAELSVVNQPYEIKEGSLIVIKLANGLHMDILERFRSDFVRYLRQTLANQEIRLETEIVQEIVQQRLYTSQDKFNYMVKKNSKLIDLKQRLGLEYDY